MKTTTYNIIHAEHGYIVGIAHSEAQARQIVDAAYMHDCTECMIWDENGNDVTFNILFPSMS